MGRGEREEAGEEGEKRRRMGRTGRKCSLLPEALVGLCFAGFPMTGEGGGREEREEDGEEGEKRGRRMGRTERMGRKCSPLLQCYRFMLFWFPIIAQGR